MFTFLSFHRMAAPGCSVKFVKSDLNYFRFSLASLDYLCRDVQKIKRSTYAPRPDTDAARSSHLTDCTRNRVGQRIGVFAMMVQ